MQNYSIPKCTESSDYFLLKILQCIVNTFQIWRTDNAVLDIIITIVEIMYCNRQHINNSTGHI